MSNNIKNFHGMNNRIPQQQQIQVDLTNATQVKCSECDSPYFKEVITLFRVSAIASPTGQELYVNRPAAVCAKCFTELKP